jgi:ABC-type Fe3+-hydroxamate transport system substrate-binding protein
MPLYTDQMGRQVEIIENPKRIISIVPSQTELLYHLGLDKEVAGITKFCIHPDEWFRSKKRIGGTKQLNLNEIRHLQPDLILANKEENTKAQVEELAQEFPVWTSDITTLEEALSMISAVGSIVNRNKEAGEMVHEIWKRFSSLFNSIQHRSGKKHLAVAYFIWREPYMSVGGDTFISHMLQYAGYKNVFQKQHRYPEININELQPMDCDLVFLSSEPYPFKQKHVEELQSVLPGIPIVLVDGEVFSWYGSRLLKAPAYFKELQLQVLSLMHAGSS